MPSCVVKRCTNYEKKFTKKHGISYHRFPADPERNASWTRVLRIQRNEANFNSNKYTRICSSHFSAKDFRLSEGGLRKLKKDAIPRLVTKNLGDNNGFCSDDSDGRDEPNVSNDLRKISEINVSISEDNTSAAIREKETVKELNLLKLPSPKINIKNQKKLPVKTKPKGKSVKTIRHDIDNIKLDYDNIDKFGDQIAFLLKRIPKKLCRELQENIVKLVQTATKDRSRKVEMNVIPNITITSSVSNSLTKENNVALSHHLLTCIHSDYPEDNEFKEISVKLEPDDIDDKVYDNGDEISTVEDPAQTQLMQSFNTVQETHNNITSFEVPCELVGSTKLVKMEENYLESRSDAAFNPVLLNNSSTVVNIKIEETDLIAEAKGECTIKVIDTSVNKL